MNFFKKIIAYPLSVIYYFFFGAILLIFHPIMWTAKNLFGVKALKKVVDIFNGCLVLCLYIIGTRVRFINKHQLPKNTPLLIVSNHQGLYDISPLSWYFRKYHPKFVSKKELGKGIPSVSYNLTHGGSVLIDRKDAKQAIGALIGFGKYIEKNKFSAIIFPEGTRSNTGIPKKFAINGLKTLVKFIPSAHIVPVTINNSWKILQHGNFPLNLGATITITVHKPICIKEDSFENIFEKTEKCIKNAVILSA